MLELRKDIFADERDDNLKEIGKPTQRQDMLGHVTATSTYFSDHKLQGMLHLKVLRSPHSHARLRRIDVAEAERQPGVRRIIRGADVRSEWRAGMVRLAACPNVVSKLSGLGTFLHRNDPAHIAGVVRETVSIFGADRCLFGSNFPIEKLWTRYDALADAYRKAAEALPPEQQRAILHDTAMRVYRITS